MPFDSYTLFFTFMPITCQVCVSHVKHIDAQAPTRRQLNPTARLLNDRRHPRWAMPRGAFAQFIHAISAGPEI
jgi:hypothetical protein